MKQSVSDSPHDATQDSSKSAPADDLNFDLVEERVPEKLKQRLIEAYKGKLRLFCRVSPSY